MKKYTTRFYNIDLKHHPAVYELEELIREFLRPESYRVRNGRSASAEKTPDPAPGTEIVSIELPDEAADRDEAKQFLFDTLAADTGYRPVWGTLTGVRPAKLANELMYLEGMSPAETEERFRTRYRVSEEKISLVMETCRVQKEIASLPANRTIGLYIGIPFCPTRCLYCAFTSNQTRYEEVERYLEALLQEVRATGRRFTELKVQPESLYLGGGTPTTLQAAELDRLLRETEQAYDLSLLKEYCVEAGRPDTITSDRMKVLSDHGVGRISINPQSMNDITLERIGRTHRGDDIRRAFETARSAGDFIINSDVIAGLPGETPEDFLRSLEEVIALGPQNITVHTLSVKRSSRLHEVDAQYHYGRTDEVAEMVSGARQRLGECGYRPFYMYRQKHMSGNLENVSYALEGTESVYNIRIMDEHQTIAALGAGGISKAYFGARNRLERVPNVSNYSIYIDRISEMIERKEKKLYAPFE